MARRLRGQRATPGVGRKRDGAVQGQAHETMVRVVAVSNRISLRAARSEASFAAELERIVGLAAPHLTRKGPNLLVLTEVLVAPPGGAEPPVGDPTTGRPYV